MKTIGPVCTLGEGPLWHPERERLFWFDIPKGELYSCNAVGGQPRSWNFGEPASAAGWVDKETLLVATASGLQKFDLGDGTWETIIEIEADNSATRSNDGRIGPDGAFWIGTMGNGHEKEAGAFYRYSNGKLETLATNISIPNATCFSPDGCIAYLSDTAQQVIWRWALDESGAPVGEREMYIDFSGTKINPDGAVCDSEGYLWNAQWGAWRVARYAPDGSEDRVIEVPVEQPTCPAFGGTGLTTLYITSATEGLSDESLEQQPDAGKVLFLDAGISGIPENRCSL